MKTLKLAFIGLLAFGLTGIVNAQAKASKKKEPVKQEAKKKEAPASARHLKKDGTPDMRYKENRKATTAKKDNSTGQKDMGSKASGKKETTKTSGKAASSGSKKAPHARPVKKK